MSWEKDTKHHDAVGRVWWIIAKANVKGNTVLGVAMRMTGAPNIYAIAVVDPDRPDTASVLLDDGFTTIYENFDGFEGASASTRWTHDGVSHSSASGTRRREWR